MTVEIVEVSRDDEGALLEQMAVYNAAAGPDLSFAPIAAVHWIRSMPSGICLVARLDGSPVGAAVGLHDDVVPSLRLGVLDLAVRSERRRRGIGSALLEGVLAWAESARMDAISTWTLVADEESRGFLERREFVAGTTDQKLALDVATAVAGPVDPPSGIRITTLAERPGLEEQIYQVACEAWPDIPGPEPMVPASFERWRELELIRPDSDPERVTIALDGERVVGYGILVDGSRPNSQYHDITGVLRDWRERGIAGAIKRAQVAWAKAAGVATLITENDTTNAPMLAVNRRLGFTDLPPTIAMRRELSRPGEPPPPGPQHRP